MTSTLANADIRGFYAALGIEVPQWAHGPNVTVRCVFDPDAHQRADRRPSLSINLEGGMFNCHGCGLKGGAYDAAWHRLGYDPRAAMQLLVRYGLAPPLDQSPKRAGSNRPRPQPRSAAALSTPRPASSPARRVAVAESDVQRWHLQLLGRADLLAHLAATRSWRELTVRQLQLGLDRQQVTIPVRDQHHQLVSLLRYQPDHRPGEEKIRAVSGSRRALFPHPAAETSRQLLLVEGEPDAIAGRSRGLPAIAIPGVEGWRSQWASLFDQRDVTVVLDCDRSGRACARQITSDLAGHAAGVTVIDLAPGRSDGYDLTDWLMSRRGEGDRLLNQLHDHPGLVAA